MANTPLIGRAFPLLPPKQEEEPRPDNHEAEVPRDIAPRPRFGSRSTFRSLVNPRGSFAAGGDPSAKAGAGNERVLAALRKSARTFGAVPSGSGRRSGLPGQIVRQARDVQARNGALSMLARRETAYFRNLYLDQDMPDEGDVVEIDDPGLKQGENAMSGQTPRLSDTDRSDMLVRYRDRKGLFQEDVDLTNAFLGEMAHIDREDLALMIDDIAAAQDWPSRKVNHILGSIDARRTFLRGFHPLFGLSRVLTQA